MVTSKQPNNRQGMTRVRTRSGAMKIKPGPVKMIQDKRYNKYMYVVN